MGISHDFHKTPWHNIGECYIEQWLLDVLKYSNNSSNPMAQDSMYRIKNTDNMEPNVIMGTTKVQWRIGATQGR